MRYTHPIDRIMARLRLPVLILAVLSAPIYLYSYAKLMVMAYEVWPGWIFAPVIVAHLVTLCAVASVIDIQQERRQSKAPEQ